MSYNRDKSYSDRPLYGIEHEIALLRDKDRVFCDYTNTKHLELQGIIEQLPEYADDYPRLRIGDLHIKKKRWYVEGYERFNEDGSLRDSVPKGIEIRTTPHRSINGALRELGTSYRLLKTRLNQNGFTPIWVSFNPTKSKFELDYPLNNYEIKSRGQSPEDQTADIAQMTFGPDLNLSFPEFSDEQLIAAGKRLTFFSPYIVPFSFSSPFKDNLLWHGLSLRTYLRTGKRPSALVFLHDNDNHVPTMPSLTQHSRVPFEKGRIEFKAFDTCNNLELYHSLFILLKGLIINTHVPEGCFTPDIKLHQLSAVKGFSDSNIADGAREAIRRAKEVLNDTSELKSLNLLEQMLQNNMQQVFALIHEYKKSQSVIKTLRGFDNLQTDL
jgi:hypothetical protein